MKCPIWAQCCTNSLTASKTVWSSPSESATTTRWEIYLDIYFQETSANGVAAKLNRTSTAKLRSVATLNYRVAAVSFLSSTIRRIRTSTSWRNNLTIGKKARKPRKKFMGRCRSGPCRCKIQFSNIKIRSRVISGPRARSSVTSVSYVKVIPTKPTRSKYCERAGSPTQKSCTEISATRKQTKPWNVWTSKTYLTL